MTDEADRTDAGEETDATGDPGDGDEGDGGTDPEDEGPVDHAWIMQVTFVTTIVVGAPVVAVLSAFVALPTWASRVGFAARVGAVVWILTALTVYAYDRWYR